MSTEVIATRRAHQQIEALHRTQAKAFNTFIDDLERNGCAALGYRLSGPVPLDRMCVKHLRDALRVVVALESTRRACILLVGPHKDSDPNLNIYAELYELLGVDPPESVGRGKPPCCGDGGEPPPELADDLADLILRAARHRKTRHRLA